MTDKYKNKYRVESTRLQCWDYGWNAAYFITICTDHRIYYFGDVVNKIMGLSDIGCLAWKFWYEIPEHFPYVKLDAFIAMPNHVHGIIVIDKADDGREDAILHQGRDAMNGVSTNGMNPGRDAINCDDSVQKNRGGFAGEKNPMLHDNLSRVVRWYKGVVKFHAGKKVPAYGWQAGFHDHIIRNDRSYENIANYIHDNPRRWNDDTYFGSL